MSRLANERAIEPRKETNGCAERWWKRHMRRHARKTHTWPRNLRVWRAGGKKRATVGVGHTILVAAYHMLKEEVDYKDLGGDYFQKRSEEKTTRRLVRQLEQFGYQVELKRLKAAA
jgi:hypothetical protein